ncbi:PLDc N-terminal domain-containing protein [Amycolatopsis rhabdoformis]|uniref:PLDc N-terminal domain-containing protein n=1 Tax=Amycolatopsis rhabdoformis TaxID=1448059 RepID=A0ABZ1IEW4_9PSEU|nr:PLDc N-terminal domain-containing protein [Amycolatopsis rhabdoformis]WSE32193.1 PLDc N-terminal domain-containing protein [Amycolatopsis rhabdoformis]
MSDAKSRAAVSEHPDGSSMRLAATSSRADPHRRPWKDLPPGRRAAVLGAAVIQIGLAAAAWWDLARRPAGEVRGPKPLWAWVIAVNFAGPIAYFRWGRDRRDRRRGRCSRV